MAVYQISRIQHRRGTSGELPDALADGEIGMTTDTGEVFYGAPNHPAVSGRRSYPYQNIKILTELDVQRSIKGDVYHHGALASALCRPGQSSVVPLFRAGDIDFGNLDWSLSSSDGNVKAMGTLQFICIHSNRDASPVTVGMGPTVNFGDPSWLAQAGTWGLTGASETGADDGYTWLRFNNYRDGNLLLAISGREWKIPPVPGFNA